MFTLELQDKAEWRDKIKPDYYVGRADRKTLMVIKTVEIKGGLIIASGAEAKLNLDDVAYIGVINENSTVATTLINAYNDSRGFPYMTFADSTLTEKYGHQISNKSILQLCEKMCQDTDIGFTANRYNNAIKVELYKPAQNPNLVFSEDYGNLNDIIVLLSTMGYKNKAIILGADGVNIVTFTVDNGHLEMTTELTVTDTTAYTDYDDMHLYVDSPDDTITLMTLRVDSNGHLVYDELPRARADVDLSNGVNVRELIVDARDLQVNNLTLAEYLQTLVERGIVKLLEATKTWNVNFQASQFGEKYDLGDTLTVLLKKYGIVITARVVKFAQTEQRNQLKTTVTVGSLTIRE